MAWPYLAIPNAFALITFFFFHVQEWDEFAVYLRQGVGVSENNAKRAKTDGEEEEGED